MFQRDEVDVHLVQDQYIILVILIPYHYRLQSLDDEFEPSVEPNEDQVREIIYLNLSAP